MKTLLLLFFTCIFAIANENLLFEKRILESEIRLMKVEKELVNFSLSKTDANIDNLQKNMDIINNEIRTLNLNNQNFYQNEYDKSIQKLQENYEYNVKLLTEKYNSIQKSIDSSHQGLEDRKSLFSWIFAIFIAISGLILLYYKVSITNLKKSFEEKEDEYKQKLEDLKLESERKMNREFSEFLSNNIPSLESAINTAIQNINSTQSELIDIEEKIKVASIHEMKLYLAENCEIQCEDNDISIGDTDWTRGS